DSGAEGLEARRDDALAVRDDEAGPADHRCSRGRESVPAQGPARGVRRPCSVQPSGGTDSRSGAITPPSGVMPSNTAATLNAGRCSLNGRPATRRAALPPTDPPRTDDHTSPPPPARRRPALVLALPS